MKTNKNQKKYKKKIKSKYISEKYKNAYLHKLFRVIAKLKNNFIEGE